MRERPLSESRKVYVPKPIEFPEGFVLVQDTREQKPLFSRIPKGLTIASATLKDGDYSVQGFEHRIAFERKGISDLFPYCTSQREKTVAKMKRFRDMEFVGLIIEASEHDVYQWQDFTKAHPESVRAAIISFQVRYGVHVYFGSRERCALWLLERAVKFYNVIREM